MQCCFQLKKDAAESLCGPKYRMGHPRRNDPEISKCQSRFPEAVQRPLPPGRDAIGCFHPAAGLPGKELSGTIA
jgi:hypothetical protein